MASAPSPDVPLVVDPEALAGTGLAGGALDALAVEAPAGTCMLLAGEPMSGKARLATVALVAGHASGAGTVAVTTEEPGGAVRDRFERFAGPAYDPDRFAVVDCTGGSAGDLRTDGPDQQVSAPNDLTGVGIGLERALEAVSTTEGRYRLLFDSLSTLLSYRDGEATFKFTHTVCSRLRRTDTFGLFTLDAPAHDERTVSMLRRVFDGETTLDAGEGRTRVRTRGLGDREEWAPVDLPE